jgi:hypothetical protein
LAIHQKHAPYYKEAFSIPGFFSEPVVLLGFPEIRVKPFHFEPWSKLPLGSKWKKAVRALRWRRRALLGKVHRDLRLTDEFRHPDLIEFLRSRGINEVNVIDLFDPRADKRYDMNEPVPESEHERYGTFIDIGSLEHVFDTRRCIENSLRMVRPGGIYMLMTNVNGVFGHGLHVFSPEALLLALTLNGFEILYHRYCTKDGAPIRDPSRGRDVIIWLVARKSSPLKEFVVPQQGLWEGRYDEFSDPRQPS